MEMVLILDSDPQFLEQVSRDLENAGYRSVTTGSAARGIELARTGNPDLILVDSDMEAMNIKEIMADLMKDELTRQTPVILMSSRSSIEHVIEAMNYGVCDYIKKPYDRPSFLDKVFSALKRGKMKRMEEEMSRSQHIDIRRESGITLITFHSRLKSRLFLDDAKRIFNHAFFSMIRKDQCVIDLRSLPELSREELPLLTRVTQLFNERDLYIVTGRHYGLIVSETELSDTIPLYISYGDLMLYLNEKSSPKSNATGI